MAAPRFLLVHGAWHGAWSFDLLRLELERRAVACEALDLPALGDDATALPEATFQAGVDRVVERLAKHRNWTLVGHSLAGFHVTEAALRSSGRVRNVVTLGGYVPLAGDDWKALDAMAPASDGFKSCFRKSGEGAAEAIDLDVERAAKFLWHDVAPGIAAAAAMRVRPQPVEPFSSAKIDGTAAALKRIPRQAIVPALDRVFRREHQEAMAKRAEVAVETIDAGHCPMLSQPRRIADLLLGVK